MKKLKTAMLFGLVLAVSGQSVVGEAVPGTAASDIWEGSGRLGSSRSLRAETFAVSTSAFPQDSVVDVTNLENGLAVRAVVVSGLGGSRLLARLSRAAAEALGISASGMARIRITLRNPSAEFAHVFRGPLFGLPTEAPTVRRVENGMPEPAGSGDARQTAEVAGPAEVTVPVEATVPGGIPAFAEVVNAAEVPTYTARPVIAEAPPSPQVRPDPAAVPGGGYAGQPVSGYAEAPPDSGLGRTEVRGTEVASLPEEAGIPPFGMPTPDFVAAMGDGTVPYPAPEPMPNTVPEEELLATILVNAMDETGTSEDGGTVLPFELVETVKRLPPVGEPEIDPAYVIGPILRETRPETGTSAVTETPVALRGIPDGVPETAASGGGVSGNRVNGGGWFVQVGVFGTEEGLDREVGRIRAMHPYYADLIVVQNIENSLARVLIGPMNQGESAAVLRRVRSMGNPGALVRQF